LFLELSLVACWVIIRIEFCLAILAAELS
jgi:hypothetical protein